MTTLDDAWKEAEAALPAGGEIFDLSRYHYDSDCGMEDRNDEWRARAGVWTPSERWGESRFTGGDWADAATPIEALLALAAKLRGAS